MNTEQIRNIIKKMSLSEKIGQLNQGMLSDEGIDELKDSIRKGRIGSLILATSATAGNEEGSQLDVKLIDELEQIAVEESPSNIPIIFGRDVIHGHKIVMPIPLALSATFNETLVEAAYKAIAKEAASEGVQWTFAPMLDISRDPRWGRCIESPGEDPYLGEKMAEAIVKAFKSENVATCAKHYLGYGAVEGGRDYGNSEISAYTMRNYYLKAFKRAIDCGTETVMNSFNNISGQTTSSSKYLIKEVLHNELNFEGFIVSDWWSIYQLINQGLAQNKRDAARIAINAGVDVDMTDGCYIDNLEDLVRSGEISEILIDEAVFRILYIKDKLGLFDAPFSRKRIFDVLQHETISQQCADEAMVLLKNKNNILPLKKECKAVMTGPFVHEKRSHLGSWTLDFDISRVESVADVIKRGNSDAILPTSPYLWDDCFPIIKNADVIVAFLGESHRVTGEANSLSDISLPKEQLEYIKKLHRTGKPIIGVLCFGRPIALDEAEKYFDAIIYAWHSGTKAANSIVKILYGEVNPSGKLPMTFPRVTGQIPIYYNDYATGRNRGYYYEEYTDGMFAYHDLMSTPMYPFGYGLSYTKFEYSNIRSSVKSLSLDEIKIGKKFVISAIVENIGKYDGKEVSQLYVHDCCASMVRPLKELKGFVKNTIQVGEKTSVNFEIGYNELGFFDENGKYIVEKGKFEIYLGTDCYTNNKIEIFVC